MGRRREKEEEKGDKKEHTCLVVKGLEKVTCH